MKHEPAAAGDPANGPLTGFQFFVGQSKMAAASMPTDGDTRWMLAHDCRGRQGSVRDLVNEPSLKLMQRFEREISQQIRLEWW